MKSQIPNLKASLAALLGAALAAALWAGTARAGEPAAPEKRTTGLAERQEKARREIEKLRDRIQEIQKRLRDRGEEAQAQKLGEALQKIVEV
ncbi:MAG: hypothetical protein MUC63_04190, partial [Planctomycetes bacterium]|nr:hypothetical protein [Planctomycetota bacterium]